MTPALYDEPGPNARVLYRRISILSAGVFLLAVVWALVTLDRGGKLEARLWAPLANPELAKLLAQGLLATLKVAFLSMALSVLFGAIFTAGLLSKLWWLRGALRIWIEIFRGLPLLLLILFIFLGGPALGFSISTFWALVLGLVVYDSAVMAEIFRAGILSLPRGQSEAAAAIGLSEPESFRLILLPQAISRMLPALITQLIALLKETSFGFVIGYMELLRDARTAVEYLGGEYALSVYTLVAVIYIAMNCVLSWAARRAGAVL